MTTINGPLERNHHILLGILAEPFPAIEAGATEGAGTVSYTHLTLPTSDLV